MSINEILFNLIMFLMAFLVVFIVIYCLNLWLIKKKKKQEMVEISYLIRKFGLDRSKLNVRKMVLPVTLIDAFIIAFVGTFIMMLPIAFIWQFLIGFVLLFGLIYALFELYGRRLVKKGYGKEDKNEYKKNRRKM